MSNDQEIKDRDQIAYLRDAISNIGDVIYYAWEIDPHPQEELDSLVAIRSKWGDMLYELEMKYE